MVWNTIQDYLLRSFQFTLWKAIVALLATAILSSGLTSIIDHLSAPSVSQTHCNPVPFFHRPEPKWIPNTNGERF